MDFLKILIFWYYIDINNQYIVIYRQHNPFSLQIQPYNNWKQSEEDTNTLFVKLLP